MDALVAKQWALSRDMCPVVTMQNSSAYEMLQMKNGWMTNLVFENYYNQCQEEHHTKYERIQEKIFSTL